MSRPRTTPHRRLFYSLQRAASSSLSLLFSLSYPRRSFMFHFSSDRLAGLDNILLRISIPSRLPSAAPNRPAALDPCANTVENLINRKSKSQASRVPLGDRTHTSNIVCNRFPCRHSSELSFFSFTADRCSSSPREIGEPDVTRNPVLLHSKRVQLAAGRRGSATSSGQMCCPRSGPL